MDSWKVSLFGREFFLHGWFPVKDSNFWLAKPTFEIPGEELPICPKEMYNAKTTFEVEFAHEKGDKVAGTLFFRVPYEVVKQIEAGTFPGENVAICPPETETLSGENLAICPRELYNAKTSFEVDSAHEKGGGATALIWVRVIVPYEVFKEDEPFARMVAEKVREWRTWRAAVIAAPMAAPWVYLGFRLWAA